MGLTIYGIARTRASRVLWLAEELGLTYRHVPTPIGPEGTGSPAFRAINPNGRIPAIEQDGLVLWDSIAINLYLARRAGPPLGPRDAAEDAVTTMWSLWAVNELEREANEVFQHTHVRPPELRDPARVAVALRRLAAPLRVLDDALARGNGALVGGRFGVAELNVCAMLFYLRQVPDGLTDYPRARRAFARAAERPAYRRMLALRGDIQPG